jgi:uncharacterized protein DUF903
MAMNQTIGYPVKRIAFILLVAVLALNGCARHYTITLNDGTQIGTVGKPKPKNGQYVFKDVMGNDRSIPVGRVAEVAPASMASSTRNSKYGQ